MWYLPHPFALISKIEDVTQLIECLPQKQEAFGLVPAPHKLSVIVPSHNRNTYKVEGGESDVQHHPWLYSEFKASLGFKENTIMLFSEFLVLFMFVKFSICLQS